MSGVFEHFYACPYCGETISSLLDGSEPVQNYIEDCEVCCRPIELHFELDCGELAFFNASTADG